MGVDSWTVLGHSFGSDLGVRYALDYPEHESFNASFIEQVRRGGNETDEGVVDQIDSKLSEYDSSLT